MLDYFGFTRQPFSRDLPPSSLFRSSGFKEALARLEYVASSRLIGVLTGEVGSGKSTVARAFSSRLDPTKNPVVYISDSFLDPRGFYREALWQLGVAPAFLRADARRQFSAVLMDLWESQGKSPVIIIDEAHGLSQEMLNEIRYLTNFRLDSVSPFSLILIGQTELRAHLRLKSLEAVKQRISVRYHLPPLSEQETKDYIAHSMKASGASSNMFTDGAVRLIHAHSRGIPRVINNICISCLIDLKARGGQMVEEDNVKRAVAELED